VDLPVWMDVIVVATADFELAHDLLAALRKRSIPARLVEPDTAVPPGTAAVLTGTDDAVDVTAGVPVIAGEVSEIRAMIDRAVSGEAVAEAPVVIGVDPGKMPGVAVVRGGQILAVSVVDAAAAPDLIRREYHRYDGAVIKLGDGARLAGARLLRALEDLPVQLVDETGTTPHMKGGTRAVGDAVAAVNIANRPGRWVDEIAFEPTAGEIGQIKARSRRVSPDDRTLDAARAAAVARGELSLEEALADHRASGDTS
jgi:hypothetical protein